MPDETTWPKRARRSHTNAARLICPVRTHAIVFAILAICLPFTVQLEANETAATAPVAKSNPKQRETPEQAKVKEYLAARVSYANLLTAYFASIGPQLIHVSATGANQQTLDIFSVAIGKPFGRDTKNLIDARDVVNSTLSMATIKKCGFKTVLIRGDDYVESYVVQ